MAVRREELYTPDAVVVDFPLRIARARARRAERRLASRRLAAVILGVGLTLGVVGASAAGLGGAVASRAGAPSAVTVQPGETLWGLAERYASPGTDPRAFVDEVTELNGLEGVLQAGARLKLP
jgi:LysM domain